MLILELAGRTTLGTQTDVNMTSRDALAAGVRDARRIYLKDLLYSPQMRQQLQEFICESNTNQPSIFRKP